MSEFLLKTLQFVVPRDKQCITFPNDAENNAKIDVVENEKNEIYI